MSVSLVHALHAQGRAHGSLAKSGPLSTSLWTASGTTRPLPGSYRAAETDQPLDGKDSDVGEVENAQAALTVNVCCPETPRTTAVISALPGATAAIRPAGDTETLLELASPR